MIPFLTALVAAGIVAAAGAPSFMVWLAASRAANWASSALACFVSWLILLFATIFVGLLLNDEQASSFTGSSWLGTLLHLAYIIGPAALVLSSAALAVRLYQKSAKS